MEESVLQWVKMASFVAAMFLSFMIGRAVERSRMIRFFTRRQEDIEKVLDEFFTPGTLLRKHRENPASHHSGRTPLEEIAEVEFGQKKRFLT